MTPVPRGGNFGWKVQNLCINISLKIFSTHIDKPQGLAPARKKKLILVHITTHVLGSIFFFLAGASPCGQTMCVVTKTKEGSTDIVNYYT